MSGTWWTRVFVIIVTLTWGVWMVTPTFVGESTQAMLEAQAAAASGDDRRGGRAGRRSMVARPPSQKDESILGLDLQGGIDMTLQVEVDEAVVSAVHRDVAPLKTLANDDGLRLADVRRARGEPVLLLRGEAEVPSDEVRRFMTKRFDTYEFLGDPHHGRR